MNRRTFSRLFAILAVVVAATALGCARRQAVVPRDDAPQLVLYHVPDGMEDQVRRLLAITLGAPEGMPPKGTVAVATGGRVLVLADARIQGGVESLIASLGQAEPPAPEPPIELTYWVVVGESGETSRPLPADLKAVEPALASLEEALGPYRFELLESVRLQGRSGEHAEATGVMLAVTQRASLVENRVVAQIGLSITQARNQVRTEVSLPPGELVVLAQTRSPVRREELSLAKGGRLLFYIVRARLIDA